jgi:T4 RnlA family RNA ligase
MKKLLRYTQFITESKDDVQAHVYHLPSYEDCRAICDNHDNFIFYESKHKEDGFDVSIFNYRLATFQNFENPIPDRPEIKAYEMRGITFVWNTDGSLYKRYLLLDKFFNVDQTPCSMFSVVKDFKIKNIYNKEDGSIASFIRLPNGKVLGKSKTSFQSDQAIEIQKIYDTDPNIKEFVDFCMDQDIDPIFEYVSPTNRIVVPYANTKLILLRMRDNKSGEYLDINDYASHLDGVSVAASDEGKTLQDLVDLKSIVDNKEGWIVQFENGKMVKLKTQWYVDRHRLFTEDLNRENTLIGLILDETIDDVLAQIFEPVKKAEVEHTIEVVNKEIGKIAHQVDELMAKYTGDRKQFALTYQKHPMFPLAMGIINGKDKVDVIKQRLKLDTKNLLQARAWLNKAKENFDSN